MKATTKKQAVFSDERKQDDCHSERYQRGERAPKLAGWKTEDLRTLRAPKLGKGRRKKNDRILKEDRKKKKGEGQR